MRRVRRGEGTEELAGGCFDAHDPGDQGFDPWNFKEIFGAEEKLRWEWTFDFRPGKRYPVVKRVNTVIDDNFTLMRTRELNNGRLAMIAMMAIFTQESLFGEGFDYDYIHLKPCLTTASCSQLRQRELPPPKKQGQMPPPSTLNDVQAPALE